MADQPGAAAAGPEQQDEEQHRIAPAEGASEGRRRWHPILCGLVGCRAFHGFPRFPAPAPAYDADTQRVEREW
jgi:hypothetical protein